MYEGVREKIRGVLGAAQKEEIIFTRGATEAINLVATSFERSKLKEGDEILISEMEHHANIVPWQLAAKQTGAKIKVIPFDDRGVLEMDAFHELLNERTRVVAVTHVSNALGTVNPIREITDAAHRVGACVLVDGAQSAPHMPIDVQALGCDFFVCSGHKMLGPSGVGVLYGRYDLLASMTPYHGGGEMIDQVTFEETTFDDPPYRFEAGTPPIAQVIGLGAAIDYIQAIGVDKIHAWEQHLLAEAQARLTQGVPGLKVIGTAPERAGLISFVIDGLHPFDIGMILDQEGIAVRIGHHCTQPIMRHFNVPATVRASFAPYNRVEDIDALVRGLRLAHDLLA